MAPKHTDCRWESGIIWLPSPPGGKCGYTSTARLWQNKTLVASIAELRAPNMKIGAGFDGGPFLNALLDDVAVYEVALDEGQIARAMEGLDPFSSDPAPSPTEPSHPTEPGTSTTR